MPAKDLSAPTKIKCPRILSVIEVFAIPSASFCAECPCGWRRADTIKEHLAEEISDHIGIPVKVVTTIGNDGQSKSTMEVDNSRR